MARATQKLNREPDRFLQSNDGEQVLGTNDVQGDISPEQKGRLEELKDDYEKAKKAIKIYAYVCAFLVALVLDFIDLLDFTGVGAVVTTICSLIFGLFLYIILWFIDIGDFKLARSVAAYALEAIVGIGVLPLNCLAVLLAYFLSKTKLGHKLKVVISAFNSFSRWDKKFHRKGRITNFPETDTVASAEA